MSIRPDNQPESHVPCITINPLCPQRRSRPAARLAAKVMLFSLLADAAHWDNANAQEPPRRTWTGDASDYWSNPNNWDPVGIPQNGEIIQFISGSPLFTFNISSINDIPGLILSRLLFGDYVLNPLNTPNYYLSGLPLTITHEIRAGVALGALDSREVVISCDIILLNVAGSPAAKEIFMSSGGWGANTLRLSGNIALNNNQLILWAGGSDDEDERAEFFLTGTISGAGSIEVRAGTHSVMIFGGPNGNTFSGPMRVRSFGGVQVWFNKVSGPVVNDRLIVDDAALIRYLNANQIGDNAQVDIVKGGRLLMHGYSDTIGNLSLTNFSSDPWSSLLDTGGGVLTVAGGIVSGHESPNHILPTVRGTLHLPAGLHPVDSYGSSVVGGLDMQAQVIGAGGISKYGNATLFLRTNNTFQGNLIIGQGIVEAGHATALGTTAGGTTLGGGALTLRNVAISGETLTVNDPSSQLLAFGTSGWTGPIGLNQQLTIYGENLDLTGSITGMGGLHLLGVDIEFTGVTHNTFTGSTFAGCDLLRLNKPNGIRALSDSLTIGPGREVRWFNNNQIGNGTANVTLNPNALMNLNAHNDTIRSLAFTGGTVQNSGTATLALFGGVTNHSSSAVANITGGRLSLVASQTPFVIGDGSADPDLSVTAVIQSGGIAKSGTGTLLLNAANTFTGPVTNHAGILHIQHTSALGDNSAGTTVADGATLKVESVVALNEPLNIRGAGHGGTEGALHLLPAVGVQSGIVLAAPATVRVNSSFGILSSVISGTGPLTKTGNGSLNLGGSSGAANTHTGDTIVAAGELVLAKPNSVAAVPGNLVIGTGALGSVGTVRSFASHQVVGDITVNAGSLLNLNGHNENVNHLYLNSGGSVQTGAGRLVMNDGGSINVTPNAFVTTTSTIMGGVDVSNGTLDINVGSDSPTLPFAPALDIPGNLLFAGGIGHVTKTGNGTLRLAGANTFNGNFNLDAGGVIAASPTAFGNAINHTYVNNHATLSLADGFVGGETLFLNSTAQPALEGLAGTSTWNSSLQLTRDTIIRVNAAGGNLTVSGNVAGPGGITKIGPGRLNLSGNVANSYAGLTVISNGLVEVNKVSGLAGIGGDVIIGDTANPPTNATLRTFSTGHLRPTANVTVQRSGLFDPRGTELVIRTLSGSGLVQIVAGNTLTVSNDVPCDFFGTFLAGTGSLTKRGAATMQLRGDSPAYTGAMNAEAGTLLIHGAMPNAPLFARNSSIVGGSGSVGDLSALNSSTVAPGTLPQTGRATTQFSVKSFNFVSTAKLDLDFAHPYGNDYLYGLSTASLGGALLAARFGSAPVEGQIITIVRNNVFPQVPITGIFGGLPEGAIFNADGYSCVVRYNVDTFAGREVQLVVTNLPLAASGHQFVSGSLSNVLVPDDCGLLWLVVTNRSGNTITNLRGTLRSLTAGVVVTMNESSYPNLVPSARGTNAQLFQIRTEPTFPCNNGAQFELTLIGSNMVPTAVRYTLPGGVDCNSGGGACESCHVVFAALDESTPTATQRLARAAFESSVCDLPKPCPGVTNLPPARYRVHAFTNTASAAACVTARLRPACSIGDLRFEMLSAHLGAYDTNDPCGNYLGDSGGGLFFGAAVPSISFRVPAGAPFEVVVIGNPTNAACTGYTLEVFGLPCPPPILAIASDAGSDKVRVHWSTAYPGWQLQSVSNLIDTLPPFLPVPIPPVISGGRYNVTNNAATTNQFYRLFKP